MTDSDDLWTGERVERWLAQAEQRDRQLTPVADVLFAAARLTAGEAVLDVGCGSGPTTRRAATLVRSTGAVTGLDVSSDMLQSAARVAVEDGAAAIDWVVADAVEWSPPDPVYDAVISRFGVMFFSDPRRAFANLLAATTPGGRLAIATWSRRDESDLFEVPLGAALHALGREDAGMPADKDAFSMYDRAVIAAVLEPAGWTDVDVARHRIPLLLGGGLDITAAAEVTLGVGPTRVVTEGIDDAARAKVLDAIAAALASHLDDEGHVTLDANFLITTARRA